jgi:hypothetical protein
MRGLIFGDVTVPSPPGIAAPSQRHIITMVSLTLYNLALIRAGFSMKDPVHQGPGQSTPK